MTVRPGAFVDFYDLPDDLRAEATAVAASRSSTSSASDARLFAFRITNAGRVSRSVKDVRPSELAWRFGMRRVA